MQDAVEGPLARGRRGPRPQPASARGGALARAGWNIDRLRVLPGTFWRGWLVVVLGRSAQFVEPFLPVLLLVELRATSELVAGVLVAAQLAATVGVAAAGPLMDRWGPVRVLRVALVGSAVTCAALAATPGPVVAVPAAIGFGVASAIWRAAAQVVVPAALARPGVPAHARATAFGLLVWASNLGAVLSAAVGAAGAPVRFLFLVQTAVLVGAAVLARILHTPRSVARTSAESVTTSSAVRAPSVGLWVLAAAVAPATALTFQAYSGLALLLDDAAYRVMVLVNAVVLVAAQPMVMALARRVPAGLLLAAATAALGVGMALHGVGAPLAVAVPLWTLAELVVIVVPPAVVAGLAPHVRIGSYVGTFQAVQGVAATLATFTGPLVAAAAPGGFAAGALALGAAGAVALLLTRWLTQAGLDHPVDCPCGAVLCRCGGTDRTCVGPAPFLTHLGRRAIR